MADHDDWMEGLVCAMPAPGEDYQVVLNGVVASWFEAEVARRGWVLFPIPHGPDDLPTVGVGPRP
jgi:hypothetical protein